MLLYGLFVASASPANADEGCTSDDPEPHWHAHDPKGHAFLYVVGHADIAAAPAAAEQLATASALKALVQERRVEVRSAARAAKVFESHDGVVRKTARIETDVMTTVDPEVVRGAEVVGVYRQRCGGVSRASVLMRVRREVPEGARPPWVDPVWRSALVPGWGQVTNEQRGKGVALGVTIAMAFPVAVGGYLYAENAAADARATRLQAERDVYALRSEMGWWVGVSGIVVAGVAWMAAVVDAGWWSGWNTYE